MSEVLDVQMGVEGGTIPQRRAAPPAEEKAPAAEPKFQQDDRKKLLHQRALKVKDVKSLDQVVLRLLLVKKGTMARQQTAEGMRARTSDSTPITLPRSWRWWST